MNRVPPAAPHAGGATDPAQKQSQKFRMAFFDSALPVGLTCCAVADGLPMPYVSRYFAHLLGYADPGELMAASGGLYANLLGPDVDLPGMMDTIRAMADGEDRTFTYALRKKSGESVWVRDCSHLYRDEDGQAYLLCYCTDISDIIRLQESLRLQREQLRVSEEEMRLAMAEMGKLVLLYDVSTRALTLPESFASAHGLPPVLPGMPDSLIARFRADAAAEAAIRRLFAAIHQGEPSGAAEVLFTRTDGSPCWQKAGFATVYDAGRRPVKAILSVEETTALHRQDDENRALRESERMLRVVAAHSSRSICRYDLASRTAYADETAAAALGIPRLTAGIPDSILEAGLVLPESAEDLRKLFAQIHAGVADGSVKLRMRGAGGKPRWMDVRYSLLTPDSGQLSASAVLSFLDVTETHEKELAYARYRETAAQSSEAGAGTLYLEADVTADVTEKQGGDLLPPDFPAVGCTRAALIDYVAKKFVSPEDREKFRAFFSREHLITLHADGMRNLSEDWEVASAAGGQHWIRSEVQLVQDPYSGHVKAYTMLRDVTRERRSALDVKKQAETDGMTGLYNKTTAETLAKKRFAASGTGACALLLADLDMLKSINDCFGHTQGDRAIRLMADTLKNHFRRTDIVGRVGGDEFMAFLSGVNGEDGLRSTVTALMRKLNALYLDGEKRIPLRGSVGVAMGKPGEVSFPALYQRADKALYHVKRSGKNDYAVYTPDMEQASYAYVRHGELSLRQLDRFDRTELDRLLFAVSAFFPMVISANLTQNTYYMMEYAGYPTRVCENDGVFDELIATGAETFHPDDRARFAETFSRKNLLAAHARGETHVGMTGRQRGDDGVYRSVRTDVVFIGDGVSSDVMEITLARQAEP